MIEIRVLGPLQVLVDGVPVAVGGPRQRALLAMLVAARGRAVAVDRLVGQLWESGPPPRAVSSLQAYVSRLRKLLEPRRAPRGAASVLAGDAVGYTLNLPDSAVDAWCLEREVHSVQEQARELTTAQALEILRRALGRWRGEPYGEFAGRVWAQGEVTRLREARLVGRQRAIACELKLGYTEDGVRAAWELAEAHPQRGVSWWLYALGLWAAQRPGDALEALRRHRRVLADELGLDPEPALTDLEQALAGQRLDVLERHLRFGEEPEPLVRPAQLPRTPATFAAREAELAELDRHPNGLTVITGPGGVGKTTLAVRWAHRIAGRYPDGQLYADLRGFGPDDAPSEPGEVLLSFLTALGVPDQRVPPGADERTAMFRGVLAGRRMLLVLDNAHDADQVRPLLPGTPGCAVVVTSRSRLDGLAVVDGARPVPLDVFDDDEAHAYLRRRLGSAAVDEDPAATAAIVDRCGGLPLALALVCARAGGFSLAGVAGELDGEEGLDAFAVAGHDLRTVFSWSYRRLPGDAAELFRRLARHPGPDFGLNAAVSVSGRSRSATGLLLRLLRDAHLIDEPTPGRYGYHDLLRGYARRLTDPGDDLSDVPHRLVEYFLRSAENAAGVFYFVEPPPPLPERPGVLPEEFTDHAAAVGWLDTEYPNLTAITDLCARPGWLDGPERYLARFAHTLACYQQDLRPFQEESIAMARTALTGAGISADPWWTGNLMFVIGRGLLLLNRRAEAREPLARMVEVMRPAGGPQQLAIGLTGLAIAVIDGLWDIPTRDRVEAAHPYASEALENFRLMGGEGGERASASVLPMIGWHHFYQPDGRERALGCFAEALRIVRKWNDTFAEGNTLNSAGTLHRAIGDFPAAVACFEAALECYHDIREMHIDPLIGLYACHLATGDTAAAEQVRERALGLVETARYPDVDRLVKVFGVSAG
ncbi:AfsR/SARP family transcriptional regulator [Actinoplanes derwentensis]|uniref:DNA-binding transcriptional activator of the SARP family n=1 Tax=Actinoplanes derwentensis TaxID=113562 RepID=A0A1H2DEU6_9ACTN|nr:BTAD domain-containing putative transcriptional regulator [Actinoplanes derwentensis]GID85006.1 SARP family transcriptional regulator [Actinoplanes derwentensis]SDT81241.1 DNA-binding transcriptional activator of the SARP family [Actinoplanes derwentensis]